MGPMLCAVLAEHGADVLASTAPLPEPGAAASRVSSSGDLDILVANLALRAPSTPAVEGIDAEWWQTLAALVDPLPRLVLSVVSKMIAQGHGKILVIGSASALRGACAGHRPTARHAVYSKRNSAVVRDTDRQPREPLSEPAYPINL